MSASPDTLATAVEQVARIAGDIALSFYKSALVVESKTDGSPVTIADRTAEQAARDWIEERFPRDGILGEELGITRPDAARRWVLDPIDGTKTFVRGVPLWGTLVGVCEGDQVLAGAAYFPAVGEMLAAACGTGCWWNGSRCRVSSRATLREATVLTTDERFAGDAAQVAGWSRLVGRAGVSRSWGDCYGYLLVSTGRAEVMVDGILSPWDAAALMPIVEEAGGEFTDWKGTRTAFGGSAVATNQGVAAESRRLLQNGTTGNEHA
ncbi:MAG: histidinol-phosphatase [Gemmatimonadaceae bacterium]|nr:histidinol-phosphatase [Gemmatimonadaceae bacterium]